ncbi:MAG TPA: glycine cleavage system protein GcvH [Syntrophales bacterium]|nr:glycine cleavage system protein GcvH [Syntrophales bacterium]HOM06297.1 glycine cleavage system protein GcvH [Syntrophales bacterium]HON99264.1 glycine cleavage system protein GcvH [Syntrophales bacterium]HPC00089.1 glycine cleavage system protein GcvH [Syntrophales bacterium]HPQ05722.1 glycine cleavage system protein GcvH [Syntrophales bacterium]
MARITPKDRFYTKEHEWALDNGDGTVTVGITDHAQELLTDIVFVELPEKGKVVAQMETLAVVESVKSVSDVYAPVGGRVVDVNGRLEEHPELINNDPYGQGWIAKIAMEDPSELASLMDAEGYEAMIAQESH